MKTLEDAWAWYHHNHKLLVMMHRLGGRYWEELPAGGRLGNDNDYRQFRGEQIRDMAQQVLDELDDLAVFMIFAVFESIVRRKVAEDLQPEIATLQHPALRRSSQGLLRNIDEGSFHSNVLELFKRDGQATGGPVVNSLIEEVSRVRQYRNWVAHGRKETERPAPMKPKNAFDNLQAFLTHIGHAGESA